MTYTEELWKSIEGIYQKIIEHPFNQQLACGKLPKEKFQFYLQQDALYLIDFSKALALVGARLRTDEERITFFDFAKGTLVAERSLHEHYFKEYGIQGKASKSPTCLAYTSYLIAVAANQTVEEALGALLPCFWIYQKVGASISDQSNAANPYQKWIDTYTCEEFTHNVQRAIAITDKVARKTTAHTRAWMQDAFVYASRFEWLFWESAYQMESWKP